MPLGNYPFTGGGMLKHGKRALNEALDALELMMRFSRAGTLHAAPWENQAYDEAKDVLRRYRPEALQTSRTDP
jgi:hypothetical protein